MHIAICTYKQYQVTVTAYIITIQVLILPLYYGKEYNECYGSQGWTGMPNTVVLRQCVSLHLILDMEDLQFLDEVCGYPNHAELCNF